MSTKDLITLSKDEYKARRSLEEAQKRGMVSLISADPRTGAQFKVNTPWLQGTERQGSAPLPQIVVGRQKASITQWYPRGVPEEEVYKYRAGACENCGAITHVKKDCLDRPRKVGAKYSGQNFKGDEHIRELDFDYEAKKDRWNGYNPESYQEVIDDFDLTNQKIEERHKKQGTDANEEFKERLLNRQYLDTEFDPKTKSSFSLRQKGDKAKYLENLDDTGLVYDGKSRAMNGTSNPYQDPQFQDFNGDNFNRLSGDTMNLIEQENFTWQHVKQNNSELNSVAMPTLTEMLFKKSRAQSNIAKGKMYEEIQQRYGGSQHFADRIEDLIASKEQYEEYDENGKIVNRHLSAKQGKSKYPEDVYPQDHTNVWGSWWNKELGWGFACCHGTDRNAICLGDKGKKMAIIKEYRVVKKREAELRFADSSNANSKELQDANKRIDEIEKIIDEQKIHINLESHKAYEKHLAEQNQKRYEDDKNNKFQRPLKETEMAGVQRERSRSREKLKKVTK